jgi:hypothetical protein
MTSSATYTQTWTSTVTEARVRVVMRKVLADLIAIVGAGLLSDASAQKWHDDLIFVLAQRAAAKIQVQLRVPDGRKCALEYVVSDDGTLLEDAGSGGIDYHTFPVDTQVTVTFRWRDGCPAATTAKVCKFLEERGWTFNGSLIEGEVVRDRAYSTAGYGLARNKVGDWR